MKKYRVFEKYTVPYEISPTGDFVQKLSIFKEINEKLSELILPERNDLVKKLRKKWLTLPENEEDLRDRGLNKGYDFLGTFQHFPLSQLGKLNGIFRETANEIPFRTTSSYIRNQKGNIEREFPPSEAVPELMNALYQWDAENKDVLSVFILHFLLLSIHPFENGNGRLARAVEWSRLRELGFSFHPGWEPEVIMHWQASRYNQALESSRSSGFVDDFIHFMLDGYIEIGRALIPETLSAKQ